MNDLSRKLSDKDVLFSVDEMPIEVHIVGAFSVILPPGQYDRIVQSEGIPIYFKVNTQEAGMCLIPVANEKQLRFVIENCTSNGNYPQFYLTENAKNDWFQPDNSNREDGEMQLSDMMEEILLQFIDTALIGINRSIYFIGKLLRKGLEKVRDQRVSLHVNDHTLELRSIIDFILKLTETKKPTCIVVPDHSLQCSTKDVISVPTTMPFRKEPALEYPIKPENYLPMPEPLRSSLRNKI